MNHNGAAGGDAALGGSLALFGVGIRDVKRLVVCAGSVARVDSVVPFGCTGIALLLLWSQASPTKRNLVGSDDLAIREKLHDVLPFEDQDRVCMDERRLLRRERAGNEEWKGEKKDRRNPALDGMQQLYIRSDCSDAGVKLAR